MTILLLFLGGDLDDVMTATSWWCHYSTNHSQSEVVNVFM